MNKETIAVIDFGSQFTQLICRKIREIGVYAELFPFDVTREELESHNIKGIILSGGPASVYEDGAPLLPQFILSEQIPILGICYGMHLLVHSLRGKVVPGSKREFGHSIIHIEKNTGIFTSLDTKQNVWMSHGDEVKQLPSGFQITASSPNCTFAALENTEKNIYGVQFHPEVAHTQNGKTILKNFVIDVCKCKGDWSPKNFIEYSIEQICKKVGNENVLLALSGGVDSSVAAALLHKAIGNQLTCAFVDTGLLRKNESEKVQQTFAALPQFNLIVANAQDKFLTTLKHVTDPEEKRKRIGTTFIQVFENIVKDLTSKKFKFLAQGTLYPDVIESAHPERKKAGLIKTHHNVGGLPKNMNFELIEPLRYLFKDEVRQVGLELGLPDEIVFRHPFPGPGLAVRIIGEVTEENLSTLRDAEAIFIEELHNKNLYKSVWQAFAVLTAVHSVGVMGDGRTYDKLLVLRAVTSEDGMTADWARLPAEFLGNVSSRIVNEIRGINRIAYDITSKPPATIEWE